MLQEQDRAKLDGIVQQMVTNKESDSNIQFVVDDFKKKYEPKETPVQEPGLLKSGFNAVSDFGKGAIDFAGDISGLKGVTEGVTEAGLVAKRMALGQAPQPPRVTPGQFIGSTAKLGLTAATVGSGGLASGLKGGVGLAARALESGAIGAGLQLSENLEKKKPVGENVGTAAVIGGALPAAASGVSKFYSFLTEKLPSRLINSDIKPLLKDLSYGKNPGRAVAKEGITANNLEDLSTKIQSKVKERGSEIGQLYDQHVDKVADYTDALSPIESALAQAKKNPRTNAGVIERLQNVKKDLLGFKDLAVVGGKVGETAEQQTRVLSDLTPREGFQLKSDLGDLTKFTGNKSDDNFVNKALKATYHKIDLKLDTLVPGLDSANSHYSDLLTAKVSTDYRTLINERQNLISLVPKLGAGAALVYGLSTGDVKGTTEAILADVALASLGSTAAKTRIAALLTKLAPKAEQALLRELPAIQRLIGR